MNLKDFREHLVQTRHVSDKKREVQGQETIFSYLDNLIKKKYTCIEQICLHLSKEDRTLT